MLPARLSRFVACSLFCLPACLGQEALSAQEAIAPDQARAEDLPPAEALLDRAAERVGPAKIRSALRTVVARGQVGIRGLGEGEFEEVHLGERAKYTVTFPGFGASTQGTDGLMSWSTDPAVGITVKHGKEQGAVARLFAIGRHAPWRSIYATADTVDRVDFEERPHFRLRMRPERGDADEWYVDAESGLLARVDLNLPDPMGGELPCRFLFADWREVDGLRFPHRKTQKVGTYSIVFTYSSIATNGEVTVEQVAPSAEVVAAAKDASKQTPQAPQENGEFELATVEEQPTATIRTQIKAEDVGKTLAVLLPEVMSHLTKAGVSPAGPPFSRYHSMADGMIDLEAGMPVAKSIEPAGRVKASTLPAGKVATTWHIGPFHKLGDSHAALEKWIGERELQPAGGCWEIYWTDPGIEPDSSKWKTQLVWPVR